MDTQAPFTAEEELLAEPAKRPGKRSWTAPISLAVLMILAVSLQVGGGAYSADLAGYDETGHYVTGLMVRSYVLSFDWFRPMAFAQAYYDHYPRVALGHWPPVFYAVQTFWTVPFTASRTSILLFMALQTALCGMLIYLLWRKQIGGWEACGVAFVFVLTGAVQWLTLHVMAEMIVLVWMLLAAWAFSAYLDSGRWRESLLFGCFAVAAIMTKVNGFSLALLPPLAVLFNRKLHLAYRANFWAPAGLVGVICLPWYALTMKAAKDGWQGSTDPGFLLKSVAVSNLDSIYHELGIAILLSAAVGLYFSVLRPVFARRAVENVWAVSAGLILAVFVFHTFIAPVREARHLVYAFPAILALAACGIRHLASMLQSVFRGQALAVGIVAAVVIAGFLAQSFRLERKPTMGASELAGILGSQPYAAFDVFAASRDARGEGAVIAELAMRDPMPSRRVVRASKVLASTSWSGGVYELLAENTDEVIKILRKQDIRVVVIEKPGSEEGPPHYLRVVEATLDRPDLFSRIEFPERQWAFEMYLLNSSN
jgi:4-amino-4-deoxy-L-arabinose transferase-like glycosyltransferase